MNRSVAGAMLAALLSLSAAAMAEPRCVADVRGHDVCVATPVSRVIALSPATTELVWSAGGEQYLRATVSGDYPAEVRKLPSVGDHNGLDLEAIVRLQPDMVVGWSSGNSSVAIERLERLGLTVWMTEPSSFADIATTLTGLGRLMATEDIAEPAAAQLQQGVDQLAAQYASKSPVSVFVQVWHQPLMTLNGDHWLSEVLSLCGGINIFAALPALVPRVSEEDVLRADPQVIISGAVGDDSSAGAAGLAIWQRFAHLQAVKHQHLVAIPSSMIHRPTSRLLTGAQRVCEAIDGARGEH